MVDVILGGKLDALRHDLPELPELDNLFAPEVSEVLDKISRRRYIIRETISRMEDTTKQW